MCRKAVNQSIFKLLFYYESFLSYLICSTSTILGTNGVNNADVLFSNKQTKKSCDRCGTSRGSLVTSFEGQRFSGCLSLNWIRCDVIGGDLERVVDVEDVVLLAEVFDLHIVMISANWLMSKSLCRLILLQCGQLRLSVLFV